MKKVMTLLAAAMLLGACHCTKCTTAPNRSNVCAKTACACSKQAKDCKCGKNCKCKNHNHTQAAPAKPAEVAKPAPQPAAAPEPVKEQDFAAVANVRKAADDKLVLSYKEPINFRYNSDEIEPDSFKQIKETAEALKKYPNASVRVAGYTDSLGNPNYNVDLSQRRAKAVALELVKNGVAADKVSFIGYGAANPVATNKTAAGRYQNRRVELEVSNK